MGRSNYLSYHPALQPLGSFSHMATCRSSSKNTRKMSLIPVLNKNLPRAHTESELGVLGVHGKACEICSSLVQKKNMEKKYFSSHKLPKQQTTNF
jgi:hypothetical protein